jgi:hypothetical protein
MADDVDGGYGDDAKVDGARNINYFDHYDYVGDGGADDAFGSDVFVTIFLQGLTCEQCDNGRSR